MIREEAARLIARVIAVWGGRVEGDAADVWMDHLDSRDGPTAWRALRSLETTEQRRPSIARFIEEYAAEWAKRPAAPPERTLPKTNCLMCGGTGWERIVGPFVTVGGNEAEVGTEGVRRCRNGCPVHDALAPVVPLTETEKQRNLTRLRELLGKTGGAAMVEERVPGPGEVF